MPAAAMIHCNICNQNLRAYGMAKHLNRMHSGIPAATINQLLQEDRWLACDICGFICCRLKGLITHRATHPGAEPYVGAAAAEEELGVQVDNNVEVYWQEEGHHGEQPDDMALPPADVAQQLGAEDLQEEVAAQPGLAAALPATTPFGDLIAMNKTGLYSSHPSWAPYCREIVQTLLVQKTTRRRLYGESQHYSSSQGFSSIAGAQGEIF
jgi:hypothetical protein